MNDAGTPDTPPPRWLGSLLMVIAVLIGIYGKPAPGVPPEIGWLGCAVFFFIGAGFSAQALGHAGIARLVTPLAVVALALVATWVAFGPGERHCSSSISFFGIRSRDTGNSCRLPFGIGAALVWLFLAWGLWQNGRGKSGGSQH